MTLRIDNRTVGAAVTQQDKDDVQAALDTLKAGGNPIPTFAAVRATLPVPKRARFVDGMLHATIDALNLKTFETP